MPVPGELHIDRYLTDISVAFIQEDDAFVFDKVFPVVPVLKQSDKFVIFDRGSFMRDQMEERPLGGRADVADWDFSEGTYRCVERALAHKLDDRVRANTDDPINQDEQAARLLNQAVAINNDRIWATQYFTTGVWDTDLDGSGTDFTQFDDSSSDPILEFDKRKEDMRNTTAKMPNTLVVGARVHRALRNNSTVRDLLKYTRPAAAVGLSDDLLARLFEMEDYVVATGVYNTAEEGATDSFDWTVTDDAALLVHAAPNPGLNTPTAGYTFAWTGLLDGQANAMGTGIERGREDFAHSDHFEVRSAHDMNVVATELGIFFQNAVASSF